MVVLLIFAVEGEKTTTKLRIALYQKVRIALLMN